MAFVKFATAEITGVKGSAKRLGRTASLDKFADYDDYRTDDGYIYVRVRAISSRVNKNHDGWPSEELAKAYRTFLGKPIFVDHNNHDPKRARGVVVDAKLHVEDPSKTSALDSYYASAPAEHLPPTWIELLLETDAKTFPKLATAIEKGDIDGVSMGCNVERSKCSHCGNWASVPEQYCQHIRQKGGEYDFYRDGVKTSKKSYEDCYDIGFFEISYVFDPADETALIREIRSTNGLQKAASTKQAAGLFPGMRTDTAPRFNQNPQSDGDICKHCGSHLDPGSTACKVCGSARSIPGIEDPTLDNNQMDYSGGVGNIFGKQAAPYGPAENVRKDKEAHPELYCPKCLWKTGGGACPRHGGPPQESGFGKRREAGGIPGWSGAPDAGGEGGAQGIPGFSGAPNTQARGIQPHPDLEFYSPDEVAETVEGIPHDTYSALWDLVNHPEVQKLPMGGEGHDPHGEHGPPTVEDPASYRDILQSGGGNMKALFHHLAPEHQQAVNDAMYAQDDERDKLYDASDPYHQGKTAEKKKHHKHHGCPVCGSRSIAWYGAGSQGICGNCGNEITTDANPSDAGGPVVSRTADTDQMPQADLLHAPQEVDTLRQEQVCPVCGNQIDDGKCDVCGFEEPPEGFGNPDLAQAQQTDMEQGQAEQAAGQPTPVPESPPAGPPAGAPSAPPSAGAGMPMAAATNSTASTVSIRSETTSATSGGAKGTNLPPTQQPSDRPKNEKRIKDATKPVESSTREETMTDVTKTAESDDRLQSDQHRTRTVDVDGQGGVISEENPVGHKETDVTAVGGVDSDENPEGHKEVDLEGSLKEELGGPTKTWGKGEGDSLGQQSPVGGESATALGSTKRSLQILPAPEPDKRVKVDAPIKEEVGGPTKTWHRDQKHAPDHAVTTEPFPSAAEAVKPEGKGTPDRSPFPPAAEGIKAASFGHFLSAMRLVKAEIALGLTPEQQELDRLAELEDESPESIEAEYKALSKVKTAGLSKNTKTAAKGSLPSLKQSHVHESTLRQVEAKDEAVELAETIFS